MDEEQQITELHWSDRPQGNKYMQKLHPAMQLENGHSVLTQILPEGKGRLRASEAEKIWVRIKYDESYILSKIIRDVIKPLNPKDLKALQQFISKAWKVHKTTNQGDSTDANK